MVARELGMSEQTLRHWVKAEASGKLNGAGAKPVTLEQMELSRMRAEIKRPQIRMHIELLRQFGQRPLALDRCQRHLRFERR